ncbi:trypsin-like peptidase domain-containing protein [uncultured Deinococcus sp.]|uniref:S1C family serine protease n=1 Tax=uncultured Deinococcus sp. TaxID=158789 RepID=UPI0025D7F18A|nr:trypsin-like peptidase domain-containing protein [uncultured Deinococcus sp.]
MTTFSDLSTSLADAVDATASSLVSVRGGPPISGSVIGAGLVLTVAHVLHADDVTVVTATGQNLAATVAGRDPTTDLALLRVPGLDVPALSAGGPVRVGELLLAVGRPAHGVQATLGFMERGAPAGGPGRGWLPSGAAPFRGVSGGALVDARGGLVGILNAGVSRGDLLAVPADRALKVAGLLDAAGRVPRGYLGLSTQPVRFPGESGEDAAADPRRGGPHLHGRGGWGGREWGGRGPDGRGRGGPHWGRGGGRLGLTVVQVEQDSPAGSAGVKVGDILLALDGEMIRHPRELLDRVRDRAGEPVTLRVLRGGEEQDVAVTVGER